MDDPFRVVKGIFDIPRYVVAWGIEEAVGLLGECGEVAVKTVKPVHKTESKGVFLCIKNEEDLERAFLSIEKRFGLPVLVQEIVKGVELFVGGKNDNQFGPVVLFGLGGIYVELYRDVSARVAPFDEKEAKEMVFEIKGKRIFEGFRGLKVDANALAKKLALFSEIVYERGLEIDVNPLIARGDEFYAVDVRVSTR